MENYLRDQPPPESIATGLSKDSNLCQKSTVLLLIDHLARIFGGGLHGVKDASHTLSPRGSSALSSQPH